MGIYSYDGTNLNPITGSSGEELIAPIEQSSISAARYEIGEQFIYSHVLYEATAVIAIGDTIAPGTNCQVADTVVEQIETINDGKTDKVSSATNGNFAALDSGGNLTDSGKKASDFATTEVVSKTANGLAPQLPNETTTTKFLRQDGNWAIPSGEDTKVTQTSTTSDSNYEVLFSNTDDDTTRTEGARKNSEFLYNPSKKALTVGARDPNYSIGSYASSIGYYGEASGEKSFSEGSSTHARGNYAHAEGKSTLASGNASHAEGFSAYGQALIASGQGAHAEGYSGTNTAPITASGTGAHAEGGTGTVASGDFSHCGGMGATSYKECSFVQGGSTDLKNSYHWNASSTPVFGISPAVRHYTSSITDSNCSNGSSGIIRETYTATLYLVPAAMYILICSSITISSGALYGSTVRMICTTATTTGTPTNLSLGQTTNAPATISMIANNGITIQNANAGRDTQFHLIRIL